MAYQLGKVAGDYLIFMSDQYDVGGGKLLRSIDMPVHALGHSFCIDPWDSPPCNVWEPIME
jgi:hypothetical protein